MYIRKHVKCSVVRKENIDMKTLNILRGNTWAIAEEQEIKQEKTLNSNIYVSTQTLATLRA